MPIPAIDNGEAGSSVRAKLNATIAIANNGAVLRRSRGDKWTVTGTTAETVAVTINVSGGIMGPNGYLVVRMPQSFTASANAKTVRLRANSLTGPIFHEYAYSGASNQGHTRLLWLQNSNSEASQVFGATAANNDMSITNTPIPSTNINTAVDWSVLITVQLASAADFVRIEAYQIEVFYGAP